MKKLEVEGGEIAIKNKNGDMAIVPKDKSGYVKSLIASGNHSAVDSFVSMLPKNATMAAKGTVMTDPKEKKKAPPVKDLRWDKEPVEPQMTWDEFLGFNTDPKPTKFDMIRASNINEGKDANFMANFVDTPESIVNLSARVAKDPSMVERFGKPKMAPVYIADNRTVRATTGQPIDPNTDLMSGKYNLNNLDQTMYYAKQAGLSKEDLWNLSAMAMQESNMGNVDDNIGHVISGQYYSGVPGRDLVNAYQDKMALANRLGLDTEEKRLQAYNGLGKLMPDTEAWYHGNPVKKFYGVPIPKEGLNLKENPLYGIQVKDLRDNVLKKNPEMTRYIDSTYSTFKKPKL